MSQLCANVPARHILIPLHDFSAGGTELIAFRLAGRWMAAGRQVSILTGAEDGPLRPRVPDGVGVHILSPQLRRSMFSRLTLGRAMMPAARMIAPDAIFIPGNFHFILGAALRRALPHAAIVAKASNPLWRDSSVSLPDWLARRIVQFGARGIDRIVAMAPALQDDVARLVGRDRVGVIADPFLDGDDAPTLRSGTPARPGAPLRLLTVGRLEPQKDPLLAIAVLAALRDRKVDAHLTLIGGGSLESELRAEIARLGLGAAVDLAGYVADPAPYYADADLLLMSSRFEGVPAAIGEALMHDLAFVATDCSAWLTALARDHPTLGAVVSERSPAMLADAVLARAALPWPTGDAIERGIGEHRLDRAAAAYLELFDSLT